MSTKSTITYGDGFHLYHELMEEGEDVYLRLNDCYFEAMPGEVTVRIPLHVWEHVRTFSPRYHAMSDEELLAHVTGEVDERIQDWRQAPEHSKGLAAIAGSAFYGLATDPRDQQIELGLQNVTKARTEELEILGRIWAHRQREEAKNLETGSER